MGEVFALGKSEEDVAYVKSVKFGAQPRVKFDLPTANQAMEILLSF